MDIVVHAADLKPNDVYDDEKVIEVRRTEKGNVSFLTDMGWRRRPMNEQLFIHRPE